MKGKNKHLQNKDVFGSHDCMECLVSHVNEFSFQHIWIQFINAPLSKKKVKTPVSGLNSIVGFIWQLLAKWI